MMTGTGAPEILVSVVCKTYNQEKYIAQAIESFLMQQTGFEFEILIQDDASTDSTTAIVLEYARKYPGKIKPVIEKENQFSKGINSHFKNSIPRALGKYIAICDGDDYWTDPLKLQKQVDFLEANEDCSYVYTKNKTLGPTGALYSKFENRLPIPVFSDFETVVKLGFIPTTLTIVFRKSIFDNQFPEFLVKAFHGDWAILVLSAYKGKIGFIDEYTCVYREGIGILKTSNRIQILKRGLTLNAHLDKYTRYTFHKILRCKEKHYQYITYSYLQNKQWLRALGYFLAATGRSFIENGPVDFAANWYLFFKTVVKMLLNRK